MNSGLASFVLAVVAPSILLHFSLLAYAQVVNVLGEPPYKLDQLYRPQVLFFFALSMLWGVAGMILAYPSTKDMVGCGNHSLGCCRRRHILHDHTLFSP